MRSIERNIAMNEPDLGHDRPYSYADYLNWSAEERAELVDGKVMPMGPIPNSSHEQVAADIFGMLQQFLGNTSCRAFAAPFVVRLPHQSEKDEDITTVVQPDICVVCDPSKLDDRGAIGAPDIVIEVLSPGNNEKDLRIKRKAYEHAGVKEYWIFSPQNYYFLRHVLENGRYRVASRLMTIGDIATTPVLPGFELDLADVFKEED